MLEMGQRTPSMGSQAGRSSCGYVCPISALSLFRDRIHLAKNRATRNHAEQNKKMVGMEEVNVCIFFGLDVVLESPLALIGSRHVRSQIS